MKKKSTRSVSLVSPSLIAILGLIVISGEARADSPGDATSPKVDQRALPSSVDQSSTEEANAEPLPLRVGGIAFGVAGGGTQDRPAECPATQPDPLPSNGCYKCATVIQPNCPPEIRCVAATTNGKKFCRITIGGGMIKCETTGSSCTSV